jgi:hypothetical protein
MARNRAPIPPKYETPDPSGVVGTYGDRAIAWAKRELNIIPGPWQEHVIRRVLRYGKNDDLIARTALIGTGRQNGKSVIIRIVLGWLLDEGRCVGPFREWTSMLAAAHDVPQARIIYNAVFGDLVGIPRLVEGTRGDRLNRAVKLTDQRGIRVGGLSLNTVTSQPGSVRGQSAGLIAWDEMLTQRDWSMWQALAPAQSAQRSPLMLLTSTAGDVESVVLRSWYDKLVRQSTGDEKPDPSFYGAWWQSDDPDAGLDWGEIAKANPAINDGRLSREFIEGEHASPPQLWRQERLNHWRDGVSEGAFGPGQWAKCRVPNALGDDPQASRTYALGVGIGPDWQRATIVAAARRDDGRIGAAVYQDLRADGTNALTAATIVDAVRSFPGSVIAVAFEGAAAGAPAFEADAYQTGHPWDKLSPSAVVAASMDVAELVQSAMLAVDDPLIDAQVASAGRRKVGLEGAFRFARSASAGPIDAFLAMVYAAHAIRYNDAGSFIA